MSNRIQSQYEQRNAATCLNRMADCRRSIARIKASPEPNLERLETYRKFWREWLALHRYYCGLERRRNRRTVYFWSM